MFLWQISLGKMGEQVMNRFFRSRIVLGFAAALGLAVLAAGELSAATVTSGFDPSATLTGAVRYRNFGSGGGAEIQVGASNGAGGITSPATGDVPWGLPISKAVTFSYDPGTGNLTTTVAGSTPSAIVKTVGSLGALNYLEITITKNTPTTSVSLSTVVLDSDTLGNFSVTGGASTTRWNVTGIDLQSGFTLTGTVAVAGLSGSGDSSYVQIDVGSVIPPDMEGPVASNVVVTPAPVLLNGEATVTATVDDSTTGNNTIGSAHYSLNGGTDTAMSAADGTFDYVSEEVEATFTATQIGLNEVCVHGTDALGNVGDPSCQTFLVTYKFDGFYSPIDNDVVNVAKAGQAIPAKWRLTGADGVPISNPASFVALRSYPISCTEFSGDPADAVEEYASGSSGLQYNGDGYWQFNWKTDKNYANTCRAMYVEFDSGATSLAVKFQFKK
jgi:hypothetical protein